MFRRALLILLLCSLSLAIWLLALAVFKVMVDSDAWAAFNTHSNFLIVGRVVISLSTIGLALLNRLSIGWPISMLCIAFLVSLLLVPAVATGQTLMRELIAADPYLGMRERTTIFFIYVTIQIFGLVFARKR